MSTSISSTTVSPTGKFTVVPFKRFPPNWKLQQIVNGLPLERTLKLKSTNENSLIRKVILLGYNDFTYHLAVKFSFHSELNLFLKTFNLDNESLNHDIEDPEQIKILMKTMIENNELPEDSVELIQSIISHPTWDLAKTYPAAPACFTCRKTHKGIYLIADHPDALVKSVIASRGHANEIKLELEFGQSKPEVKEYLEYFGLDESAIVTNTNSRVRWMRLLKQYNGFSDMAMVNKLCSANAYWEDL